MIYYIGLGCRWWKRNFSMFKWWIEIVLAEREKEMEYFYVMNEHRWEWMCALSTSAMATWEQIHGEFVYFTFIIWPLSSDGLSTFYPTNLKTLKICSLFCIAAVCVRVWASRYEIKRYEKRVEMNTKKKLKRLFKYGKTLNKIYSHTTHAHFTSK